MRTDGRADTTEVIGSFPEYANVPKNPSFHRVAYYIALMGLGTTRNSGGNFWSIVDPKMSGPTGDTDHRGAIVFGI
jgi:hypothetical protein